MFTPGNQPDTLQPADIAVARAVQAAAPAGWMVYVTGLRQLENTTPARPGNGVIAEAMLGALGAGRAGVRVRQRPGRLPLAVAGVLDRTTFLVLRAVTEVTEASSSPSTYRPGRPRRGVRLLAAGGLPVA